MITLKTPQTNQIKQIKTGYSWTTLFFGAWPALFRGDWFWALIILLFEVVNGILTLGFGVIATDILFGFFYNRVYIDSLLAKGWIPSDNGSKDALVQLGVISK